jgi:hypothetical protein
MLAPGFADIAAQQGEIANHVNVLNAHQMLRQAHAVDHHDCIGLA